MSFSQNQQDPMQQQQHQGIDTEGLVAQIAFPKTFITPCFIEQPSILTDWRYEYRRVAQQIDDTLWLGPLCVVRKEEFLQEHNIRVLISISDIRMVPAVVRHKYEPSGDFKCLSYDPGNRFNSPLQIVSQLTDICKIIEEAEQMGVSSLVYCESGNDASAIVATSYMIYKYHMSFVKAIQHVQSKRFSIALDDAAKYNLRTFEDICSAQRPIDAEPRIAGVSKKSRMREDVDEDDEEYSSTRSKMQDTRE